MQLTRQVEEQRQKKAFVRDREISQDQRDEVTQFVGSKTESIGKQYSGKCPENVPVAFFQWPHCGGKKVHRRKECPAQIMQCHGCGKLGP